MSDLDGIAYAHYDLDVVVAMAEKTKAYILAFRADEKKKIIDEAFNDLVEILKPASLKQKILYRIFYRELMKYTVGELQYMKENSDVKKVAEELLDLHARAFDMFHRKEIEYDYACNKFSNMMKICDGILRSAKRNFDIVTDLDLVGDFADTRCIKDGMITLDVRYFDALYNWSVR